mgnify:FL=1
MHLLEIRQTLYDTEVTRDILDINKLSQRLNEFLEQTEDLSYCDFAYISALTSKAKTLLYKAYTIFNLNQKEVERDVK